jgi:GNAT superfamily N-acetyltransferase
MKLKIINFKEAPADLRFDTVKSLYDQWENEYEKYSRIYDEDDLEKFLDSQYAVFIFVEDIAIPKMVGTITISNDNGQPNLGYKSFWISNLLVSRHYRKQNVGSTILGYAEKFLQEIRITYVSLTCLDNLCDFYKKRNYKQIGFHPVTQNAILMKSLAPI